jgi:hypothetical protein
VKILKKERGPGNDGSLSISLRAERETGDKKGERGRERGREREERWACQ